MQTPGDVQAEIWPHCFVSVAFLCGTKKTGKIW